MPPLLQLAYASSATVPMGHDDLLGLLRVSRRNNAAVGVTGALLYAEGNFMQVLEGPAEAVDAVYARVCRDPRHRGTITLLRAEAAARSFPDWSMGFRSLDGLADEDRAAARSALDLTAPGPDRARRLLASFRPFLPGERARAA